MTTPRSDDSQAGKGGTQIPPGEGGPGPGHNVTKNNAEVRAACASAFEQMAAKEADRKRCNEEISAIREGLYARGLNKHAVRAAYAYWKMDPQQRDGFDDSLAIARSGVGLPIQAALFEEVEQPAPSEEGKAGDEEPGADNGTAEPRASGRRKKH